MSHPLPPKPSATTTANAPTTRARPPTPTLISPTLNLSVSFLLSTVALPPNPIVICRSWAGPDEGIDAARRHIVDVASGAPDIGSALAALVQPDPELSLWAFAIVSAEGTAPRLAALDFRSYGLKETTPALSHLDLAHLYPCSRECDESPNPCADCTKPRPSTMCPLFRTAPRMSRAVRRPLRRLYAAWLAALRSLVLDKLSHPRLLPTRTGVLVSPSDNGTGEWGKPWLDPTRALTHAHVHISLIHPLPRPSTPNQLLIQLVPHPTSLVPFPPVVHPPSGTAVLLLPSSVQAYVLGPYTNHAPHGFLSSLAGRGVQPSSATSPCLLLWLPIPASTQPNATSPPNVNALPTPSAATPAAPPAGAGSRGMYIVWPRALCVIDTAAAPVDTARLPNIPTNLMSTGSTVPAPTRLRRFPTRKPTVSHAIVLSQSLPTNPTASSSQHTQPQLPPSPTISLPGLANSACTLIEAIVRAREKEKEKQRARIERGRSGSAVPIPGQSLSGASTPTTATAPPAPPPLHIHTQISPGTALYPSPLANTPHQVSPLQIHPNMGVSTANMSPAQSDGFDIGMDLFGDQEGDSTFVPEAFTNDPAVGDTFRMSGEYPSNELFGSVPGYDPGTSTTDGLFGDSWNIDTGPGSGEDINQSGDSEMNGFAETEFDFFNAGVPDLNLDLGLDLNLGMPVMQSMEDVTDLDPTPPVSAVPTTLFTPTPKPYFPLTPPADDRDGYGSSKAGLFDPLRFTQKFEAVDSKYRHVDGKFMFRLGRRKADNKGSSGLQIELPPRAWTDAPPNPLTNGLDVVRATPSNVLPEPRIQACSFPQLRRQLLTPFPSSTTPQHLRAGYIGLTNPSAKRIRMLRQAHTKAEIKTTSRSLPVFAKDWESNVAQLSPAATLSDTDSDSDSECSDGGVSVAVTAGISIPSRGTTPPLSAITSGGSGIGVPPGPGLAIAHFRPSVLGSGALGEVLAWPDPREPRTPASGPVSVPTPVSPGDVVEQSKATIEAAANVIAREAVDNWAWGLDVGAYAWNHVSAPSRAELVLLGASLGAVGTSVTFQRLTAAPKVEVVNEVLTDRPYPHHPRFEKLKQPKLAVGHSGQVTQMDSSVLRFWDTVGLEPIGGAKDVIAFVVFEGDAAGESDAVAEKWLANVSRAYESRRLGKHTPGDCGVARKGVVRVRWESAAKTLGQLVASLPFASTSLVFYVLAPTSVLSASWLQSLTLKLESDALRPDSTEACWHSVVHLVSTSVVFDHNLTPSNARQQLESIAISLYDRIPRTVGRRIRRSIIPLSIPLETIVHVPAYTIGRILTPRFRFSLDWPDKQREMMDRHMFLHVAYGFSECRRWLCAACMDERGEAYETKVWRVFGVSDGESDPNEEFERTEHYARLVWRFAKKFASRAGIEWRVVICRMGVMPADELDGWDLCLAKALRDVQTGIHVSVLSFDHSSGLVMATGFTPSVKAAVYSSGPATPLICSLDTNDFLVLPGFDTEIYPESGAGLQTDSLSANLLPLATAHFLRLTDPPITRLPDNKVPDLKYEELPTLSLSSRLHLLHVAVSQGSSLWKAGGDQWRELLVSFYSLTVLTRVRMPPLDHLPYHLAMLVAMMNVLNKRELVPVDSLSGT